LPDKQIIGKFEVVKRTVTEYFLQNCQDFYETSMMAELSRRLEDLIKAKEAENESAVHVA
jgi:hypothetical protein